MRSEIGTVQGGSISPLPSNVSPLCTLEEKLRRRMHAPIGEQLASLRAALTGHFRDLSSRCTSSLDRPSVALRPIPLPVRDVVTERRLAVLGTCKTDTFEEIDEAALRGEAQTMMSFFTPHQRDLSGWRDMIGGPIESHEVPDDHVDMSRT